MNQHEESRIELEEDPKPKPFGLMFCLIAAVWLIGALVKAA